MSKYKHNQEMQVIKNIKNETMKIYSVQPSIGQKSGLFYVYIFEKKRLTPSEERLITKKHADTYCQMNILGHSLKEYSEMQAIIFQNAKSCKRQPRITLVACCPMAKEILYQQKEKNKLHIFKQVFLCFQKDEPQLAKHLKTQFSSKINAQTYSLRQINDYLESARSNLSFQSSTFKNFYQMNQKDKQFSSLRARLRFLACYNIKPNEYQYYKQQFKQYLHKIYSLQNKYIHQTMLQLGKCIQQLKSIQMDVFADTILRLYQNSQLHFYKIINEAALKIYQRSFQFQKVALPLSFMFKGMKYLYHEYHKEALLDSIFGKEDFITVYRLAKMSKEQIDIFRQKKGRYFQNYAFLSTSLSIVGALKFLVYQKNEKFNYALLKIKLYRHNFQINQIQSALPFMSSSFAFPPYNAEQKQVILNIFSVFVPTEITEVSLPSLLAVHKIPNNNWELFGKHAKLPIISMESNTFHSKLANFQSSMSQYERQTKQSYIIEAQRLSKFSDYCMGDAYLDEKKWQQCQNYNKKQQEQLQKQNNFKESTQPDNNDVQLIKKKLRLVRRHSDCAYGEGKQDEAVSNLKKAISLVQDLSTKDKSKSKMEHAQEKNQIVQRISEICFNFQNFEEAKSVTQTEIKRLRLRIQLNQPPLYNQRFQLVQLLNILGIHYFKRSQIKLARLALRESQRELDKILKELDYENLKKQTFYILWIVHFFLKSEEKWQSRQVFQKKKRCQNIAEITKNFGIGQHLQNVVERSNELQKSIRAFLLRKREIIQQSNSTQEEKEIDRQKLFDEVEDQFKNNDMLHDLKPNIQQFFRGFERSKNQLKKRIQSSISKKIKDLQEMVIVKCSTSTGIKFQQQYKDIINKKEQIIKQKIFDWLKQKKSSSSIQEVRQKIDNLIISLRYNYVHLYRKQVKRDYQTTKILMDDTVKIIGEYLSNIKKMTDREPSYQLLFMESKYCQLYIQNQRKQKESEAKLQELIDRAKDNPCYYSIMFGAYKKLIYIYESNADITYFKDLDYINQSKNVPLKRQIRTKSKQPISEGKQYIKKAINELQKASKNLLDDKMRQQIKSWEIRFLLAKQEFDILGLKLQNDTRTKNSRAKQSQLLRNTIKQNSELIESLQSNNDEGEIFHRASHIYNQALFLYDVNFRQSLDKIKQSLNLAPQSLPDTQRLKILLMGTYLFSSLYIRDLNNFAQKLIIYQKQMGNYGFYWKISLSLYIYFKFKKDTTNKIEFISRTYDFARNYLQKSSPIFKAIKYEYEQTIKPQQKSLVRSRQTIIPAELSIDGPQNTINQENTLIQIIKQNEKKCELMAQHYSQRSNSILVNPEQLQFRSKQEQQNRISSQKRESQGPISFDEYEEQIGIYKKYHSLITKKGKRETDKRYMKQQKPITQRNEQNEQDLQIHLTSSIQNNQDHEQFVQGQPIEPQMQAERTKSSLYLRDNLKQDNFVQAIPYSRITKYSKKVASFDKKERVNIKIQKEQVGQNREEMRQI